VLRRGSTLAETLDGLPGVASSWFGPNANRPTIRGQDGDRVHMLSNAGASVDASSLSFDHAVPLDPLVVERIEVLRGPAALLYGGSAIAGVVNAIDNRIPRAPVGAATGAAELRVGGAARERSGAALVEGGGAGYAVHADAFVRGTDDLRVPAFDRPLPGGGSERRSHVANSASRAQGGALGASMLWDHGHLGASIDSYRNRYGIVVEDDVSIRMQRDRVALAGEARVPGGAIRALRGQWQSSRYRHDEVQGSGAIGTTFRNAGTNGRLELEHAPATIAGRPLRGVFGLQAEQARFSALGDEAFVPDTRTRQRAVFAVEELALGAARLSFGVRHEHTQVDSSGGAPAAPMPRFGAARLRRFDATSASVGAMLDLAPRWQLSGTAAYGERAPTHYELYADGLHVATAAYERGNAALGKDRGASVDVALQWKDGPRRWKLGAWAARYASYVALLRSGEPDVVGSDGGSFPVYAYAGVPARLAGVEAEAGWRLLHGTPSIDLDARLDALRATRRDTGEPLPRIAPLRATLGFDAAVGAWKARAEVVHAARQTRVPADDTPTAGWTIVNLTASHRWRADAGDALLFAKLSNLFDALAWSATSVATVRPLAPLSGRALQLGLQWAW
jgi:iron complex outermembrane receptor protein